eukprot:90748_1
MLTLSSVFLGLIGAIGVTLSLDADVIFNCDNAFVAKVSKDDGATWTDALTGGSWKTAYTVKITDVTADTILDIHCDDNGVVGGFIGQVLFAGETYYTTNPIEAGKWTLESSTDGITSPLVYTTYRDWRIILGDPLPGQSWIWNANVHNTMVFRFDFGNGIIGTTCEIDNDCEGDLICCPATNTCHPADWSPSAAAKVEENSNVVQLGNYKHHVNDIKHINKYDYNWYYNIIIIGVILFVLINNAFICYWCVCKDGSKRLYNNVKVEEFNED